MSFVAWIIPTLALEKMTSATIVSKWPLKGVSAFACEVSREKIQYFGDFREGASHAMTVTATPYGLAPLVSTYNIKANASLHVSNTTLYTNEMPVAVSDKYGTFVTPTQDELGQTNRQFIKFSHRDLASGVKNEASGYDPDIPYHQYLSRMYFFQKASSDVDFPFAKWIESNMVSRVASRPFSNIVLKGDPYSNATGDKPNLQVDFAFLLQPMEPLLAEYYSSGAAEMTATGEIPGFASSASGNPSTWWKGDRSVWMFACNKTTTILRSTKSDELRIAFSCLNHANYEPLTRDVVERQNTQWSFESETATPKRPTKHILHKLPISVMVALMVAAFTILCLVIFAFGVLARTPKVVVIG